jgi:hypothetical protein
MTNDDLLHGTHSSVALHCMVILMHTWNKSVTESIYSIQFHQQPQNVHIFITIVIWMYMYWAFLT